MGWGTQPLRRIMRLCSPLDCRVVMECQQNLAQQTYFTTPQGRSDAHLSVPKLRHKVPVSREMHRFDRLGYPS